MTNTSLPPAGLGRRLAAMVYDALLLLSLAMLYGALFIGLKYWVLQTELGEHEKASMGTSGFIGLVLLLQGFFWYFWCHGGQTLGMRAWRLQLRSRDGTDVSLSSAARRGLAAPISLFCAGLGYLWCLWDKEGKSWHDHLSGTEVVLLPKPEKNKPT